MSAPLDPTRAVEIRGLGAHVELHQGGRFLRHARRGGHAEAVANRLEQAPTMRRKCLNCGAAFTAQGRFQRLCKPCRAL
ncbi:MAG: hypothetical protein AAF647_02190 [Pseudomonadota bacterium]